MLHETRKKKRFWRVLRILSAAEFLGGSGGEKDREHSGCGCERSSRRAVLSACQTAIQDVAKLPDEAIGLPAGLTQAGLPSVPGTMWSVNDASTTLLMVRFYELLLRDRLPPPVALRQAQLWLRDATNAELDAYLSRGGGAGVKDRAGASGQEDGGQENVFDERHLPVPHFSVIQEFVCYRRNRGRTGA